MHYAASLSFIFIYPLRDFAGAYPRPLEFVKNVLLFREGSDLLIFYVIMVGVFAGADRNHPARVRWAVAICESGRCSRLGSITPYALSLPIQQNFMVVLWQMIFIMGMLAGGGMPKWDALNLRGEAPAGWRSRAGSLALV